MADILRVSAEVYRRLLELKHVIETKEQRIVSMREVVDHLDLMEEIERCLARLK